MTEQLPPGPSHALPLRRLDDARVRIERHGDMRVDGVLYADELLLDAMLRDGSARQVVTMASLPGIVGEAQAMPDAHRGYGFPIGGVAAFDPAQGGVVSPGAVGYDINCGVRLHSLPELEFPTQERERKALADALARAVPAGLGVGRDHQGMPELEEVLAQGARAMADAGVGSEQDLERLEDGGALEGADPSAISKKARGRGWDQLGTLGSGNHFLELGRVAEVYDPAAAERFGLRLGGLTLLVHSGSRGLGHQFCEEVLLAMQRAAQKAGLKLADRQLVYATLGSPEAEHYLAGMAAAANFAFANRALLAHRALGALCDALDLKRKRLVAPVVYDVCHNIAKWEEHSVGGERRRVCVHRKGATRAFGPGESAVSEVYRELGQPVLIPGDMGRYSFVLRGLSGAMERSFGSACHGAGRALSREGARNSKTGHAVLKELTAKGITVRAASVNALVEEMPEAYKDVADVVSVVERAGLAARVARLEPLVIVKG